MDLVLFPVGGERKDSEGEYLLGFVGPRRVRLQKKIKWCERIIGSPHNRGPVFAGKGNWSC